MYKQISSFDNFRIVQSFVYCGTVTAIVKAFDWWRNRNFDNYFPLVLRSDYVVVTWVEYEHDSKHQRSSKKTLAIFRKLKDAKSFYKSLDHRNDITSIDGST